jgi:hypothetical protein
MEGEIMYNWTLNPFRVLLRMGLSLSPHFMQGYSPLTALRFVVQIEREQALVNANKELIALFEQKIKDRIARVWGEE